MQTLASSFFPLVATLCKHSAKGDRYIWYVFFAAHKLRALKICATVINGRDTLLIAKDLREIIFVQRRELKEPTKSGDWQVFSPECLGLLWCQTCILFIVRILICCRQTTLSINGSCAIAKLRTCVQQHWGTVGPAEDAVSVSDWNVFIFLGLSRTHAGGRRRRLI